MTIDDKEKETLRAILTMASKDSLGRLEIQSTDPHVLERIGIILSPDNPRLALIKRFQDEEGRGEEGIVEMPLDKILEYTSPKSISIKDAVKNALRHGITHIDDATRTDLDEKGEITHDEH